MFLKTKRSNHESIYDDAIGVKKLSKIALCSGSQTMRRGTLLRRQMSLGVPQKILKLKSIK